MLIGYKRRLLGAGFWTVALRADSQELTDGRMLLARTDYWKSGPLPVLLPQPEGPDASSPSISAGAKQVDAPICSSLVGPLPAPCAATLRRIREHEAQLDHQEKAKGRVTEELDS
jgi:hypothetical protein